MNFSIIIPTYNRAHILPMCLDTLIVQDYPKINYEIIVVDNNSKDNTKEVVSGYADNNPDIDIKYVLEQRQGLVFARHTGAKKARHEILSFMDDDGLYNPEWLKEISKTFKQEPEVAAVASKIVIRWDKEPPAWVIPYEWLLGKLDYGDEVKYQKNLYINGGSFSIKKSVLFLLGGFNVDQIGDWLYGDGEDGINRKLWGAGFPIGWTPNAIMEHYQFVEKNATIKDIKRRYINFGITTPYKIFVVDRKGYISLMVNLLKRLIGIIKTIIKYLLYSLKDDKENKLLAYFEIFYHYSQIPYTLKLFFNPKFRSFLLNEDWKLS